MLKNSESYYARDVMQNSGPLNNTTLYQGESKNHTSSLFCLDDPYWQEVLTKNWRREDQYKTPSIYAWSHKQHGILGEVFDVEEIRRQDEDLH